MKRIISIIIAAMMVFTAAPLSGAGAFCVKAATGDKYTVNISGTYDYSGPQEMMQYINEERQLQGRSKLTLDADLTDAAMQRAAEIAYYFDHERPDGRDCYTINSRTRGENIAAGHSTAKATYTQWYNSSGHYQNMIRATFTNIGIGHFKHNGVHYWVQMFSTDRTKSVESRTGDKAITTQISIVEKALSPLEFNGGLKSAAIRDTDKLELQISAMNADWVGVYCVFDADSFTWSSSNKAVATVSADGMVTPVGLGETTITAKVGSTSASIKVRVSKDIANATVAGLDPVEYTGSEITPPLQITYDGTVLQEGVDYEVTYSYNVNAGIAYVKIRGIGRYGGEMTKYLTINRKNIENLAEFKMKGWDCTGYEDSFECAEDNLEVYLDGQHLQLNKDYYIYTAGEDYRNNKLCDVGVSFTGNYSGSKLLRCLDDAAIKPIPAQAYTGSAIKPDFTLYWDEYSVGYSSCTYTKGEDYTVEYSNNVEVGTATIKIIPINGNYGSAQFTFKICNDISKATVAAIADAEYTGRSIEPELKVTFDGKTLKKNVDYTVTYRNNVEAGTAEAVIEGCGNYAGMVTKEFHIHKYQWVTDKAATETTTGIKHQECISCDDIRNENTVAERVKCTHVRALVWEKSATCTEPGHTKYYVCEKYGTWYADGQSMTPITEEQTIVPARGHNFVSDRAVAATVHSAGRTAGSYCSRCDLVRSAPQTIPAINKILLGNSKFVYNGLVRKPAVTVRDTAGNKLSKTADYTVTYKNAAGTKVNPKNVGKYKAVVTFKGNYSGTEEKTFVINPKATIIKKLTKPAKKQIKVTWQKRTVQVTGYQIRYSTKQSMTGSKTITISKTKTTSRVIKSLKAKKKYYVQVRTYKTVNGKKFYSAWSAKKSIKTK